MGVDADAELEVVCQHDHAVFSSGLSAVTSTSARVRSPSGRTARSHGIAGPASDQANKRWARPAPARHISAKGMPPLDNRGWRVQVLSHLAAYYTSSRVSGG
jgi:hypothetical protein